MVFNDTSGGLGIIQDIEFLTNLGAGNISGSTSRMKDFTRLVNSWYQRVVTMILRSRDEWDFDDSNKTDYPILTASLVSGQQDYTLPLKTLKVKRVEISYDGTTWKKAEPFDIAERGQQTENLSDFSKSNPFYDVQGTGIFFYPIPDSNDGKFKIWVAREPNEFTTSSTSIEPGFDEPFHRMLSIGPALDYSVAHNLPQAKNLKTLLDEYEARLMDFYGSKQEDRKLSLRAAYTSYK